MVTGTWQQQEYGSRNMAAGTWQQNYGSRNMIVPTWLGCPFTITHRSLLLHPSIHDLPHPSLFIPSFFLTTSLLPPFQLLSFLLLPSPTPTPSPSLCLPILSPSFYSPSSSLTLPVPLRREMRFLQTGRRMIMMLKLMMMAGPLANASASWLRVCKSYHPPPRAHAKHTQTACIKGTHNTTPYRTLHHIEAHTTLHHIEAHTTLHHIEAHTTLHHIEAHTTLHHIEAHTTLHHIEAHTTLHHIEAHTTLHTQHYTI